MSEEQAEYGMPKDVPQGDTTPTDVAKSALSAERVAALLLCFAIPLKVSPQTFGEALHILRTNREEVFFAFLSQYEGVDAFVRAIRPVAEGLKAEREAQENPAPTIIVP